MDKLFLEPNSKTTNKSAMLDNLSQWTKEDYEFYQSFVSGIVSDPSVEYEESYEALTESEEDIIKSIEDMINNIQSDIESEEEADDYIISQL